ncbi:MAG: hypothetical protein IK101_06865 [Oscillospiraceae bacterium]|jgi:hypothetical protein|nr:hypothetical protein [Oscillospiraceae bacterium]
MIWIVFAVALTAMALSAAALAASKGKTAPPAPTESDEKAEEEMRRFSSGVAHVLGYEIGRKNG